MKIELNLNGDETVEKPDPPKATEKLPNGKSELNSSDKKREASWPAVLFYIHLNILGLYGIMVLFTSTSLTTVIFSKIPRKSNKLFLFNFPFFPATILTLIGICGVTCGSHRLWAHKTYSASLSLRITLMLFQTMAGQVI